MEFKKKNTSSSMVNNSVIKINTLEFMIHVHIKNVWRFF